MRPVKWTSCNVYVIIDIDSRRVVGRCVADKESAALFKPLFDAPWKITPSRQPKSLRSTPDLGNRVSESR